MVDYPEAMLVVESGSDDASVIPLDQRSHVMGKLSHADIALTNPYISRRHAEILREEDQYQIRDLGSKNGTFLNDYPVGSTWQRLNNGDRIELARGQVVMRFQTSSTTITLPPPAEGAPAGALLVDARSREVRVGGVLLEPPLSRKEFDVLHLLYRRRGEACSKDQIAAGGWPERTQGDIGDQEIEQCIRRLRLRVEPDPSQPRYILTVRGYGYKLAAE
ncbi:FHA domain-containing protein [Chloroflexota bacterium]